MFSQGSNDSNYSGPSSGGDLSYEENDKNHINRAAGFNAVGGGSGGGGGQGGQGAHLNRNQQRNQGKTTQKVEKDAKQELELCRVIINKIKT